MAKFYVQSGNRKLVVSAMDSQAAALWLVHRSLDALMPIYENGDNSPEHRCEMALFLGLKQLGNQVYLSQRGFDRQDAESIDVFELIQVWHQLTTAILRLQADFNSAD